MTDERHPYDPKCPMCTPAMIDVESGALLPEDSPEMVQVMKVWNSLPFKHREAFINVTVFNSRAPDDMLLTEQIGKKFEGAMKLADRKVN